MNLLMIVVDARRGSRLNEQFAPRITRYAAEKGINFRNHFSGGNSSRMGMFTLFYGLPPGYWSSFSSLQRASALEQRGLNGQPVVGCRLSGGSPAIWYRRCLRSPRRGGIEASSACV